MLLYINYHYHLYFDHNIHISLYDKNNGDAMNIQQLFTIRPIWLFFYNPVHLVQFLLSGRTIRPDCKQIAILKMKTIILSR